MRLLKADIDQTKNAQYSPFRAQLFALHTSFTCTISPSYIGLQFSYNCVTAIKTCTDINKHLPLIRTNIESYQSIYIC